MEISLHYTQLAFAITALLISCGVAVWIYLCVEAVRTTRRDTAPASGDAGIIAVLSDRGFREAHKDHLHFADLCFLGAAALLASAYLNG